MASSCPDGCIIPVPSNEQLERLAGRATVLSYYDILQNDAGGLMFILKPTIPGKPDGAVLLHDDSPHALLVKNRLFAVICDFLHPTVREAIPATPEILVIEGAQGDRIHTEYMVPVCRHEGIGLLCASRIEASNREKK